MRDRLLGLAAALVALVATWLGIPSDAAAIPSSAVAVTYTYDGHDHATLPTYTITERGPPAAYERDTTYDSDGNQSVGAFTRHDAVTTPATYDYDGIARLAQDAHSSQVTKRRVGEAPPASPVVVRSRVAAKGAGEAGALVRYDAQAASRNLLGQVGEGYARTPSGYTVSAHAAERIVYGAPGRSPTTLGRVDDILNNPTRSVMRPDGSIRVFQGKDWVAVPDSGPIHIITVMVR